MVAPGRGRALRKGRSANPPGGPSGGPFSGQARSGAAPPPPPPRGPALPSVFSCFLARPARPNPASSGGARALCKSGAGDLVVQKQRTGLRVRPSGDVPRPAEPRFEGYKGNPAGAGTKEEGAAPEFARASGFMKTLSPAAFHAARFSEVQVS